MATAGLPWPELTGPLLGAAFESGLLPLQSTPGIAAVPAPALRPRTRRAAWPGR
jgi:hypothetical protein